MFWCGCIVGMFVGGTLGFLISALFIGAHRGDYNGNDKSL